MSAPERPRFARGFRVGRFLVRAHAYFFAVLAAADVVSNWSTWLAALKLRIAQDLWGIAWIYLSWIVVISLVELTKLKFNHDLLMCRYENAQAGAAERSRRRGGSKTRH